MKKIYLIFILMLFVSPVYACDYSTKSKQRVLANNVNFNLDYYIKNDDAVFKITITGLDDDLYIMYNNIRYDGNNIVIDNLNGGMKYKFDIYSDTYGFCSFGTLRSKSISTPVYNKFYNDSLCLNHKNESICNRWVSINMSYDDFKKSIASLEKKEIIDVQVDEKKSNLSDYLGIIIICFTLLSCGISIFIKRRNVGF